MYVPASFRVENHHTQLEFVRRHSFATLITCDGGSPFATHLPVLYEEGGAQGTLVAHMARANPQWRHFCDDEVLTIFQGPHAYVSPSWYDTELAVPTWNYAAVHVYGVPRIINDHGRVCDLLQTMIDEYESSADVPWTGDVPSEFRDSLIESIVAFEVPIGRIEAKFKLSQNRPAGDQQRVYDRLRHGSEREQALATLMVEACDLQSASDD